MDEGLILHPTHGWGVPPLGASIHGLSFDSWMEDIHEWCAKYPFPLSLQVSMSFALGQSAFSA